MKLIIVVVAVLVSGAAVIADAAGDLAGAARAAKAPVTDAAAPNR